MASGHDHDDEQPMAHDESNWLVSYADMMTLLFGFFVLMYAMSRVDQDKYTIVAKELAKHFGGTVKVDNEMTFLSAEIRDEIAKQIKEANNQLLIAATGPEEKPSGGQSGPSAPGGQLGTLNMPGGAEGDALPGGQDKVTGPGPQGEQMAKGGTGPKQILGDPGLEKQNQTPEQQALGDHEKPELLSDKDVEIQSGSDHITMKFKGSLLFGSGSARLKDEIRATLGAVATKFKENQRLEEIIIEGHTDDNPIKTGLFPSNWELSAARATGIVRFFEEQGIDEGKLVAYGFGSSRPEKPNRDDTGKAIPENQIENRRVIVRAKFAPLPRKDLEQLKAGEIVPEDQRAGQRPPQLGGAPVQPPQAGEPAPTAPETEGDYENILKKTEERLANAQKRLREIEEAAKRKKRLEDMQRKIENLTRKAEQTEKRLDEKAGELGPGEQPPATPPKTTQ